eukprot:CAMPEP_0113457974 /NCGR_PEP_ID=MMETSP0014_2-20120614/9682_1 /TAXON_ID=2857 /ORGANISM="Nitzschia sp." /LENGTH=431 /DNA_ID=CAMNT_0000349481 /DNA_START=15 /DNA_END=1313 /DNA_ORIENTATION=+ /assembly_acc=CAM_ASM_000159
MFLPTFMSKRHAQKPLTMIAGTAFRHRASSSFSLSTTPVRLYCRQQPTGKQQKQLFFSTKNFRNQPQSQRQGQGRQSQRQFQLFPGPRRIRYNLSNPRTGGRGRGGGGGGGGTSSSSTSGQIPTYFYYFGGVAVIGTIGAYVSYLDYAPLTHRRRWIATDPEFEKKMGDQNYQQLIQQQFRGKVLPRHHPASKLIERVGSRIFDSASDFANKNNLQYFDTKNVTFTVVDSEQANAFVLPGNHVFFLTGMFKYAQTEDGVGCILGHEMAHNLARHQGEKMSGSAVVGLFARLSLLFDPSGGFMMVFLPASQLLAELPNSRTQETEADEIGMYLAAHACYDPSALGRVFARMDHAGQDGSDKELSMKPPEFLSTHPSDTSRINNMKKWLPETNRIFHQDDGLRCRDLRRQIEMGNRIIQRRERSGLGADGLPF